MGWKPIILVEPNPNESPPTVRWSNHLVSQGIDRQRITDAIAELVAGPEPPQWS